MSQSQTTSQENALATAPIGKLLFSLAVPAITAQVVNMLYNIVDRIYIGHIPEIGTAALTGVGITFPIITLISAFSSLIAMGGAPRASIAMGADKQQVLKAFREAEAYKGPSLIIAYAPCINQGIRKGMGKSQEEAKKAVEAGYWPLYRYNPDLAKEGKNPFTLDSKPAKTDYKDFIMGEVRYASLKKLFPAVADQLFDRAEKEAENKYEYYKKLSELD